MSFGGAWYLLILLTAVPAGLLLSLAIEQIQPFGWRFQAGRMVEVRELPQSGRASGYPSGFRVEAVGEGRGSRRVLQYITVYGGGQKELRVLPQRWVLHFNSIYTHVAEVRYTPAIAQRYVNDSFPTAAEVERIRLAAEVDRIIRELAAGGLPNQDDPVGAGTTSRQSLDESVMLRIRVVVIPLFVLSALVAVSVVRRRVKRTLRERWREDFQKLQSEREPVLK
jgi:hypothetical protein